MSSIFWCGDCLCTYCLHRWKGDCRYGKCYDDHRAVTDPYTDHHPERHMWSDSRKPGEQEHWCRGGIFYHTEECEFFVEYEGQTVEQCVKSNIQVFQDGSRVCSMMVNGSCERCLTELSNKLKEG